MGNEMLVYHPTVTQLVKFLDTTAGREKVLRLLQYLSRFIAGNRHSLLAKHIQLEFTMVRKLLRFLKPLNHLQLATKFLHATEGDNGDLIVKYANVVKNLSFAIYLSLDQINLFRLLKLIPVTPFSGKKVPRWANMFWLYALLSGIVMDLRKIQLTDARLKSLLFKTVEDGAAQDKVAEKAEVKKVAKERFAAVRRLVWDSVDSFIVLNNLSYLSSRDDAVGIAGVITSLFGLQDLWQAASTSK